MTKRKYKNFVRKHRNKYPRRTMQEQKQSETPASCTPNLQDSYCHPSTVCDTVADQTIEKIVEIKELQSSLDISSDTRRSDALRIRRAKRALQDPATKKQEEGSLRSPS